MAPQVTANGEPANTPERLGPGLARGAGRQEPKLFPMTTAIRGGVSAWSSLTPVERLKISCFVEGVEVTEGAAAAITGGGRQPLTVHEYSTTGGVTFVLPGHVYVNAPFDDWFTGRAAARLDRHGDGFRIDFEGDVFDVERVLPLPGYLDAIDPEGRRVTDVAMSHADRVRLSPIDGCAYDCKFCDLPAERYRRHPADQLVAAMKVALADDLLPVDHGLISGGSPGRAHYGYFEEVCRAVVSAAPVPFDIMMSVRENDSDFARRMVEAGVRGFSLNIEASREMVGEPGEVRFLDKKAKFTRAWYEDAVLAAVEATGGDGRVRSLIIIGLEPVADAIRGITWLAERGCDPVLSPFRPARNTQLATMAPPGREALAEVLVEARQIVADHGVQLGPRCVPCQHNTLTFPWDVRDERATRRP